jgi:hypothetical protein
MGFCTKCGRTRTGDTRFCTGCGAEFADAPDTQPHPATQLVDKPASWDVPQPDEEDPETQVVSRRPREAPAEADHPATQIADKPSWDAAAQPEEYPQTQAVAKPAFWDQAPAEPAPATVPQMEPPSTPPGQYQQPAGYPDAGQYQPSPQYPQGSQYPQGGSYQQAGSYQQGGQYPQGAGYPQPDPWQQPGGYPPGGQYPPGYQQPGDAPGGGGSGNGRRVALIVGATLVILAAGGGAFAVVSSLRGGSPSAQPTATVTITSAPPSSTSGPQSSTATPIDSGTPTPTPTTPSPTPTTPAGPVTLAQAAAGNSASGQVVDVFNRYFNGINNHDYATYSSALTPAAQANQPESDFNKGYETTTDSNETVSAIYGSGANLTAVVTFTSNQDPKDSVDGSACNNWQLTFPLVAQGNGYLIGIPAKGSTQWSDC